MRRAILIVMLISLTVFTYGCSGINIFSNSAASSKILRESKIGTKYQMYQIEVSLSAGGALPIILELADGDKVDGYFYVEKGDDSVAFDITTGATAVYKSDFKNLPTDTPVSDRFSFNASMAQGGSYVLKLSNTSDAAKKSKSTIFFEVIYPGTDPIFTPITK